MIWIVAVTGATAAEVILTTAAEVKRLSPQQAALAQPVSLEGIVTVTLGSRAGFFLQDATGGVFVGPKKGTPIFVRVGDWVRCKGSTTAGQYAPMIDVQQVEYLGARPIPAPVPLALAEFASGRHDAEWVEASGVVHTHKQEPDARPEVQISVGRERLRVLVCDVRGNPPEHLVGAEVRLQGAASGFFNQDRQLLMPVMFVPDWRHIVVTRPAQGDPFASALRSTTSLFRYAPDERWGQMSKLKGAVTHFLPGKAIFLRDDDGAIYVETTQTPPPRLGDIVEVAGFPAIGTGAAFLQDSIFRVVGSGPEPVPIVTDAATISQGRVRPSELISIEGTLLEATRLRERWVLTLKSGEHTFDAHLETSGAAATASPPEVGSRLHLTGIAWTEGVDPKGREILPSSFRILLRARGDIVVLDAASWWTRGRLLQIVATMLVAIMISIVWIWMLRRRVVAQTSMIAERAAREAVAEERARTACEIHDTVAQGFMALGFQLQALSSELDDSAPPVRQQLDRTMKMLRHSHDEVRHSLKQLRGQAPEARGLAAGLRETLERGITHFTPEHFRYAESGTPFPLPAVAEHNVLRIAQEAATNAAKHAAACNLEVELRYDSDGVHLRVADDGCGFGQTDPAKPASADHFGLQIMRERAQRIGAQLEIRSRPGSGTEVSLFVPRPTVIRREPLALTSV